MIKNDRQLKRAEEKLSEVQESLSAIPDPDERAPYEELASDIEGNITEYLKIRGGRKVDFKVSSLDELPEALVKARLARGMTQKELAERVGVPPQQVQRDERGGYERASLWRLADVVDALEYEVHGHLRPREVTNLVHIWHADTVSDPGWAEFHHETSARALSHTSGPSDEDIGFTQLRGVVGGGSR